MTLLALAACARSGVEADDACPAEYALDEREDGARTIGTRIPGPDGTRDVHVEVRSPDTAPAEGVAWPVAVAVHGGWSGAARAGEAAPTVGDGLVVVRFDLPGESATEGLDDRRGPAARGILAAVLRYAAGEAVDDGGCTLPERAVAARPDDLYLVGTSNGGNLAVATLADADLDLPEVAGLVAWETPAGALFATVALGNDPTVYRPGTCALDAASVVTCPFPGESLLSESGSVCFDLDVDAACGSADVPVEGVEDPVTGARMLPPELVAALESVPDGFADPATAAAWWAERDAAHLSPALVDRWPSLPVLLVASEEDHVLGLSDHPHVFGLGEALQDAGAAWTRLNPGAPWLGGVDDENAPDAPLSLAEAEGALLAEDVESPLGDALAAAVRELSERRAGGDW